MTDQAHHRESIGQPETRIERWNSVGYARYLAEIVKEVAGGAIGFEQRIHLLPKVGAATACLAQVRIAAAGRCLQRGVKYVANVVPVDQRQHIHPDRKSVEQGKSVDL